MSDPLDRCSHCGRRVLGDALTISAYGTFAGVPVDMIDVYHANRRACRVAAHENQPDGMALQVPSETSQLTTNGYGAALLGADYIRWPWWLRYVPDRWLDGIRREGAVRIGGAVERDAAMRAASAAAGGKTDD